MAEEEMFNEAMGAIRQDDKRRARDLLARLLKVNPEKVDYWIWMSSVVESSRERIYCLEEVLKRDPNNATAKRGLVILGVLTPDPALMPPAGKVSRKWQAAMPVLSENEDNQKASSSRFVLVSALVLVVTVVLVIIFVIIPLTAPPKPQATAIGYHPTPPTAGPSPTSLMTSTPVVRTPTATFVGPTPLWMQMKATYTPTPLFVNTPHPQIEAYRAAMTAYSRGDLDKALGFFKQAQTGQPDAVDVVFYIGECYRLSGDYADAVDYYNQAIELQPSFAPAYLGRARATYAMDPKADVMPDLNQAVLLAPDFGEVYLEQARISIDSGDYAAAHDYLAVAAQKLPDSALIPLYQAQAYLASGDVKAALAAATLANQLDFTSLPAYRLLGEVLQANGQYADSIQPLALYLVYETGDSGAWVLLGKGYTEGQDWQKASAAFDQAIALDKTSITAYLGRGAMYLASQDGKKAAADFNQAVGLSSRSFEANLGLGRAYMLQEFYGDAYNQFRQASLFAKTDVEKANLYYWMAIDLQSLKQLTSASQYWQLLLGLPTDVVPTDWAGQAQTFLTGTPTPIITPSLTATPTVTMTPTITETFKPPK